MEMSCTPRTSFGRVPFGKYGVNKLFLMHLFIYMDLGIQFFKDVGLIRSKVTCNIGGCDMTWCADAKRDGFRWRCWRKSVFVCSESKSIRHTSRFQHTNLTFQEVLFLTYDNVRHESACLIKWEHGLSPTTIADWGQFCRDHARVHGGLLWEDWRFYKTAEID